MARIVKPLTLATIRAHRPDPRKRTELYDGRGLVLVVPSCPLGRKPNLGRWFWEFRFKSPVTGKRNSMTLGKLSAMGIAEAREARDTQAAMVARGFDPLHERRRAMRARELTFETAAESWDASRAGVVDDRTRKAAMDRLRLHVFPHIGDRPLVSISPPDVKSALDPIRERGNPETAHRCMTVIHQVFEWAEQRSDITANPVRSLRKVYPAQPQRHFAAIIDPVEFGRLLLHIDAYGGHATTRGLLRLSPLVMLRPEEVREARWSEIDLETATWRIPAERMKMRRNGEHIVPLATQTLAILRELHRSTGAGSLVFPGMRPGRPLSNNTVNTALTAMGFGPDVHRAHGFRTSASTMLNEMAAKEGGRRFNFEHVEAQLHHRPSDRIRDAYMRAQFLEQRRTMMQAWADECDRMRELARNAAACSTSEGEAAQ